MDTKLFKVRVDLQEQGKYFYIFYLKFETGVVTRIKPNTFVGKDGKPVDNYRTLVNLAVEVDSVDSIKHE